MKKVKFHPDTILEKKEQIKCIDCGWVTFHKRKRELYKCIKCERMVCERCIVPTQYCMDCYLELRK